MGPTSRKRSLSTVATLVLLLAGVAGADTYSVDRFDDSTASQCSIYSGNDCGLRGAILRANSNPGDDVVRLQAGTYTLTIPGPDEDDGETGDLDVTDTILIVGRGPELTVVDAGGDGGVNDRVFDLNTPGERLILRGLTVTGGSPDTGAGGGIRAQEGLLRLETCVVAGNELYASTGTAIYSISDLSGGHIEVVDSWLTGNTGQSSVLVTDFAHIERTTVSGNTQTDSSAVVVLLGANSLLLDSTFDGSTAPTSSATVMIGSDAVAIQGCTLLGRDVALSLLSGSSATLANTLIAGWCGGSGQLTTLGGNLESPGNTCGLGGSDLVNVPDPGLSALGFFGGPTPVYRPLDGSPAVEAPIAAAGCPALDQRGLSRPQDGDGDGNPVCDIGAVELAGPGEILVETFDCGFTTAWSVVVR